MFLSKIKIKNYRLLINVELSIDKDLTLIVGRNNTAKTSVINFIINVLSGKPFSYDDYPLLRRKSAFTLLTKFINKDITYEMFCEKFPKPSIEFYIDYSTDPEDELLGTLSPFIIDILEENNTALIKAEYCIKVDENSLREYFSECISDSKEVRDICSKKFNDILGLKIYAINPQNHMDYQEKTKNELEELFPQYFICAERGLGEDNNSKNTLPDTVSNYFKQSPEELDEDKNIYEQIQKLKIKIKEAEKDIQNTNDSLLKELIDKAIGFGYQNSEELQIGVNTDIDLEQEITNNTELAYISNYIKETLPNTHNGLGYKNLLKIQINLASFAKILKDKSKACIPLLFIEEPESHMHPQMQQAFAQYLIDFINKISNVHIQAVLTTHSSHIANTTDFSKIRYARKRLYDVKFKNLGDFAEDSEENIKFIKKYLTISRCDMFFTDKIIFVEGASERLLIPDMIKKCEKEKLFDSQKYKLPAQYYSLIEIGGAFAHKFIQFVNFLDIPSLVLTDIDPLKEGKSSTVKEGETTSNSTIEWWYKKVKNTDECSLDGILLLTDEERTIKKCHLEFQTKENGTYSKSLEEAIRNANRTHYGINVDAKEEDLEFKGKSKTEFALNLILNYADYSVPQYIKQGLIWLNDVKVLS